MVFLFLIFLDEIENVDEFNKFKKNIDLYEGDDFSDEEKKIVGDPTIEKIIVKKNYDYDNSYKQKNNQTQKIF